MEDKDKFVFVTVVCDGCASRVDSNHTVEKDCRLRNEGDLLDYLTYNEGWKAVDEAHDKYLCKECAENPANRKHPGEGRIIREEDELYGVRCDLCGKLFIDEDDTGGSHFIDRGDAIDEARGAYGWTTIRIGEKDEKDYCPDCWHMCKELEEDLEGDCKDCPNYSWCEGEGEIPNKRPFVSFECPGNCPYFESTRSNHAKCNLPEEEAAKCPRLTKWAKEKKELIAKGRIDANV